MAGLLGGLDPQQYGLLSAGLSMLANANGPNARNAIGAGAQAGLQGLLQGQQFQEQQEYQAERRGLLSAQAEKLRAEQAAQQQQRDYLSSFRMPQGNSAMAAGGGPSLMNAAQAGQPRPFDPRDALAAGLPIDLVKALAESGNFGKSKVGNYQTVTGADGKPTLAGLDEFGQPVQTGLTPFEKSSFHNLGGTTVALDPLTGATRTSMANSQTPDGAASNAVAWANNQVARGGLAVSQGNLNVARDRLELDRTAPRGVVLDTANGPMIVDPRGGGATPVTMNGAPVTGLKQQEANQAREGAAASFKTALNTLDTLEKHPGFGRSVGAMSVFPTMPGSDSANFQAQLDTFKAQTFLPMVAALKGMGSLSNAEGEKLSQAVGALDPRMSEKALRGSIQQIRADLQAAQQRAQGGGLSGAPPAAARGASASWGPPVGTAQGGYVFKGGNPADPSSWARQ